MKVINSYNIHGKIDSLLKDFKDLYKNRNNNLEKEIVQNKSESKITSPFIKRYNTEYIDIMCLGSEAAGADNVKINNESDNENYIDEDLYGFLSPDDSILKKYKDTRTARMSFLFKTAPDLLNKLKEQVVKRRSSKFQTFKNIKTIQMSPKAEKKSYHDV